MPGDRFLEVASAGDRRVLDALFRHAREGVTIQGREGLVYANDTAARLMGFSTGLEMMGADLVEWMGTIEMIGEDGKPFPVELLPGRRVLAGQETSEVTIGYRLPGSREPRWSRLGASPIKNDAGEVIWALNFFLDISTEMRLRGVEKILSQVSEDLTASLRTEPNLKALAEIVVPSVASYCGFRLLDEFDRPSSELIVFPATREAGRLFELVARLDEGLATPAVSDWSSISAPRAVEELAELSDPEAAALLEEMEIESVVTLPLIGAGTWLGSMHLVRTRAEAAFDGLDLFFLRELAGRAGVALANSRLYELEYETAQALRMGLTPVSIPDVLGLEIAARYQPLARSGHVGGDFYDVIDLGGGVTVLVIGDVEGKGVGAAATVGTVRQSIKSTVALSRHPKVVFRQLNRALADPPYARMCTVAYMVLERREDGFEATVSLAGHPPPLIVRADGTTEEVGVASPPAGVMPQLEPRPESFHLGLGDTIIAYTDGIAGPDVPSPFMVARLLPPGPLAPAELLDGLLSNFYEEVPDPRDDIALLAAKVIS